jgi:hypothetical protein
VLPHVGVHAATFTWSSVQGLRLLASNCVFQQGPCPDGREPSSGCLQCLCFPVKHNRHSFCVSEGVANRRPNSQGSLRVSLVWRQRLAPNSSFSKVRFNPDEPNLRSFGQPCAKSVTLVSWSWSFACITPSARSVTTHNWAATSLAGLLVLRGGCSLRLHDPLWIADVVLKFLPCGRRYKKRHSRLRPSEWQRLCLW